MSFSIPKIPSAIILIALILITYLFTLCPTVYLGDSGELSAAAFCLGVPHGSGYPLYVLVGKGFCLLPFGDVGFRMNLMSAVFGVLSVWAVYLVDPADDGVEAGSVGWRGGVGVYSCVLVAERGRGGVHAACFFCGVDAVVAVGVGRRDGSFGYLVVFALVTGLSFGNHLADGDAGAWDILCDFVRGPEGAFGWEAFFGPVLVFRIAPSDLPVLADTDLGRGGDPLGGPGQLGSVLGACEREVSPWGVCFQFGDVGVCGSPEGVAGIYLASIWGHGPGGGVGMVADPFGSRWRVFFGGVVFFDLFYTVFLNTISLEITPFNLSVCLALAIGIGVGVVDLVRRCEQYASVGAMRAVRVFSGVVPGVFLVMNFGVSDQLLNYTAYEHALNIFRTTRPESTLFLSGDNYVFPAIYGRLVERMREDLYLYDRYNIFFKMPGAGKGIAPGTVTWEEERNALEKSIIVSNRGEPVYYALLGPHGVEMPDSYRLIQEGILYRLVKADEDAKASGSERCVGILYHGEFLRGL
jgi:hypothetical protein